MLKTIYNLYLKRNEPVSLIHFVTNKCNARCKHCFIDFNNKPFREELSLNEIETLSKSFKKTLLNISLTGGEPFIREDITEIARIYLKNTSIESLFIATNGYYTNIIKQFIESLNTKKNLYFSISIDNFEKEHDKNRQVKGLFKRAIETYNLINSYNKQNIQARINITITPYNYKKIIGLYEYLKGVGINTIIVTIMREEGVVKKIPHKEDILEVYKVLSRIIYKEQEDGIMNHFGKGIKGNILKSKDQILFKVIEETYLLKKFIMPCRSASLSGIIYPNGDVYPCEILDMKLGNLRDYNMNFMGLWNSKETRRCREFIKKNKCSCTFECAYTINIISNPRFIKNLLSLKNLKRGTG